jgi:hypothetical protein
MNDLIPSESNQMIIARAELDSSISTAKAYPRNPRKSYAEALEMATLDQDTAESCFYCLARRAADGSKSEIKGPSVRLAEIMAYAWGNLHAATRIVGNDGKHITVEAVAIDLEKNLRISQEVKRSIKTKSGATYGPDMQQVTAMAASSVALRNALFKVIPKSFINQIYAECVKKAIGDTQSLGARRQKAIAYFAKHHIEKERILAYLEIGSVDEITAEHLELLIGISNSLKDGMVTPDNAFPDSEAGAGESKADKVNALLGQDDKK